MTPDDLARRVGLSWRPSRSAGSGVWSARVPGEAGAASAEAERVAGLLRRMPGVHLVRVRGGFVDVELEAGWERAVLARAVGEGEAYGTAGEAMLGPPERWVRAASGRRTLGNPVLLVQLAHARLRHSLASAERGVGTLLSADVGEGASRDLVCVVAGFPLVVRRAVAGEDPHVLARFLETVARLVVDLDLDLDSLGDDLAEALRVVLTNGLRLLDTAAPARI